jgi:phosphoribosylformylglycinamidine synthase PurS subunit
MRYRFEVVVGLKDGLVDPQGKAVMEALPALGWTNVPTVRVGKSIVLDVESETRAAAEEQVAEMAERFLTNPVIERFHVRPLAAEEVL